MTELLESARTWVGAVHPHARHLERALDWVLQLDPDAGEALQLAAVLHDIERAFPTLDGPVEPAADPSTEGHNEWHQIRSSEIARSWLRKQRAPDALVEQVGELIRFHESGGWPEADMLQAADSLSFLEIQTDMFLAMVADGRRTRDWTERKLRFMQERIRIPRARELGAPHLATALARLDATDPPSKGEPDACLHPREL